MTRRILWMLSACTLALAACSDQPTQNSTEDIPRELLEPTLSIVDALTGGNQHFFWLDPISDPGNPGGVADPDLYPRVEICERVTFGDTCTNAPLLATFYRDQGANRDRIKVDHRDEYSVKWRMNDNRPDRGGIYRIRVLVGTQELGHADIIAIRNPFLRAFIRHITNELVPISDRGNFQIGFRVEEGALEGQLCDFDGDGDIQDCDVGVERPGDGQPTQVQVTGTIGGQSVIAGVITAPDGVFTDINGNPIPDVILTAELEITPPSDDVFPDPLELPFFVEVNTFPEDVYIDPNGPGVSVVICQDTPALVAKNVTEALHPQLVLYKVGDNGTTRRLVSTFGAPECDNHGGGPGGVSGFASLMRKGAQKLLGLVGPQPLTARRLHGGLNTVIRRDVSLNEVAFSTFGAALGANAAQSSAVVPPTVVQGQPVNILIQTRTALGDDFLFGGDVLDVQVASGPNAGATVAVIDNLDGTYAASYNAAAAGVDQISIILDRQDVIVPAPIGGSPYSVTVTPLAGPGVADGASSAATVPGGAPGFPTYMWVTLSDGFQNPLTVGGDNVQASVSGANTASGTVTDNGDGSYLVEYTPGTPGLDQVALTVNGMPIASSPFNSTVHAPVQWSTGAGSNNHWYQFRPILRRAPYSLWTTANAEANASSYLGMPGHLLVVDALAEQNFLAPYLPLGGNTGWIGFDDAGADGTYEWATGQILATGVTSPQIVGTCVASFCNFAPNEPNRNGGVEFYGEIGGSGFGSLWNDIPNDAGQRVIASVIEYEPSSGSLEVTVTDGASAIPGVTVSLQATAFAAVTNANGVATFTAIPTGSYTVGASLAGYTFGTQPATVNQFALTTTTLAGTMQSPGVITGTIPGSGTSGFGQMITINGTDFPAGATVEFSQGGPPIPAQFTYSSGSTRFVVRSPDSGVTVGPVDITVTSSLGTSASFPYTFTATPAAPVITSPLAGANLTLGAAVLVEAHGMDTNSSRYEIELIQNSDTLSIKGLSTSGGPNGLPANIATIPIGTPWSVGSATIRMRIGDGGVLPLGLPYGPWTTLIVNLISP